jgi:hypothetical protein
MSTQSLQTTTTPARSDLPRETRVATTDRPFRRHGLMLSVGAVAWASAMALFGLNQTETWPLIGFGLGAGAFQVGLLCLLRVLWRTRALGDGRVARTVLRVEAGMLVLAMGSTFVDAIALSDLTQPGWLLLDAFWPLSMMGMFFIGIRIAVAGRWKGATRFWPLVAESWAVVVIPTMGIFGHSVADVVAPLHLLIGYTVLGVLVSRKEA